YSSAAVQCHNNVNSTLPHSALSLYTSSLSSAPSSASLSFISSSSQLSLQPLQSFNTRGHTHFKINTKAQGLKVKCSQSEPLKVMISGAPASGKGTQCEMIVQKFGLVHISTGDLLRAEVSAGTEIGNKAKEYMNAGSLVPDEIVTAMVKGRLSQKDTKEKGWLLDGYPRSFAQAQSLEEMNIRPDVYITLDVPDEILIDRCVGRKLDPLTGKIYHVKYFPPETEEIKARLVTRSDDNEEKVKSRLQTYKQNAEAILSTYFDILHKIDGNRAKDVVFRDVDSLMSEVQKEKESWRGIPTRLNNIPHSRDIREYFYDDVLQSTQRAINDGKTRLKVEINIPELNPEMVCVQGSMGEGALAGMPLQLAGTRKILEFMDWGDYDALGNFINIGSIGAKEVEEQDDIFILVAPQNAVGNCIIFDLQAMTDAAGDRPVILINPRLKDLPASSGIMQTMGRDKRLEYAASFENCYLFRLLYYAGTQYPIMAALRMSYPYRYELYKRVDELPGKEKYVLLSTFAKRPNSDEINYAFEGKD
ncbi:hypothetical protein RJ640_009491, partial [Escallonia rubra]